MKNRRLVTLCIYNIAYRPRMSVVFKLSLRAVVQWKYSWWCMYKYVLRKVARCVAVVGELALASWVIPLVLRRLGGSVHYNPCSVLCSASRLPLTVHQAVSPPAAVYRAHWVKHV